MFYTKIIALVFLISCTKSVTEPTYDTRPSITAPTYHLLSLGDSYTIGQSVSEADRFPAQTIFKLKQQNISFVTPTYIARTGWTTTNLISSIQQNPPSRSSFDFVTLLIGVNNQYQNLSQQQYQLEFTDLLDKAISYANNKPNKVCVLSIPDWGVTPFANGLDRNLIAKQIDSFNIINKQVALLKTVNYLDITASTRLAANDNTLLAVDGLHPSGKEYEKWATQLTAIIKQNL
jgi:lysophospholipase L1-like esterase